MLSRTYLYLHTMELQLLVITEEEQLDFIERHGYLTSFAVTSLRVEQTVSVYETLTKLAELLFASCPNLGYVNWSGAMIDEHGSRIFALPRKTKEIVTADIDPLMAELPFSNCLGNVLLGQLVGYICRRRAASPLGDLQYGDNKVGSDVSLWWAKHDLPSMIGKAGELWTEGNSWLNPYILVLGGQRIHESITSAHSLRMREEIL